MIDLFAGCGGLSLGFQKAGFRPVLAVEFDQAAAATYAVNFGEDQVICRDIAKVRSKELPDADVIIGGPPCQGFSALCRQDPDDPRNQLWQEYLRIVAAVHPQVFVIENVPMFLGTKKE